MRACLVLPFAFVELPEILNDVGLVIDYPMLLLNALTAFALNLAVFLLIGKTSALTMNIAGVIKDWMLIFASQHLFGNAVSFLNYVGYVIAFLSVGMYNFNKLRAAKRADKQREREKQSGGGESRRRRAERGVNETKLRYIVATNNVFSLAFR